MNHVALVSVIFFSSLCVTSSSLMSMEPPPKKQKPTTPSAGTIIDQAALYLQYYNASFATDHDSAQQYLQSAFELLDTILNENNSDPLHVAIALRLKALYIQQDNPDFKALLALAKKLDKKEDRSLAQIHILYARALLFGKSDVAQYHGMRGRINQTYDRGWKHEPFGITIACKTIAQK